MGGRGIGKEGRKGELLLKIKAENGRWGGRPPTHTHSGAQVVKVVNEALLPILVSIPPKFNTSRHLVIPGEAFGAAT